MTDGSLNTSSLQLNAPAPYFEGRSTQGPVRLSDYRGQWLIFFAHPADFTPVCASEFVSFARHSEDFTRLECKLLGLSVDSVFAHLAWRDSIRERFDVSIDFPIIADVSLNISRRYGMLQPQDAPFAVRALFIIDPEGLLRAMLYYPASTGRSVAEVLRLLQALQTTDRLKVVTPEGWQPGQEIVERPPDTVAAAEACRALSFGCVDWYYYRYPADKVSSGNS